MWINLIVLAVTIIITTLIVMGFRWIERNKEKHPEVYAHRRFLGFALWLIFNSGDIG